MPRLYGPGPADPPPLVATRDLAGLRTRDVADRPVGALFGALSEEDTGLIRYLDVALEGLDRHVLVPIGHARIDNDATPPRVRLRAATFEDLLDVPAYEPDATPLDRGYQTRLLEAHGRLFHGARYYAHPAFDHRAAPADAPLAPATPDEEPDAEAEGIRPLSSAPGHAFEGPELREQVVRDGLGADVGEVVDVLVDTRRRAPRYAVVRLADPPRPAAIPVGYLDPADDGDGLVLLGLRADDIRMLPGYGEGLTREEENEIQATIESRLTGERYFHRPDFRPGGRAHTSR